jgi:hypothetical protein
MVFESSKTGVKRLHRPAGTPHSLTTTLKGPDPYGQAAIMLCESLLHLIVEQGVLSQQKVVEAIEGVAELIEEAAGREVQPVNFRATAMLVDTIRETFIHKD